VTDVTAVLELSLPGGSAAAARARSALETKFGTRFPERDLEDLMLVVSELVTNAVRHAGLGPGEEIAFRVAASDQAVRIEVDDPEPQFRYDLGEREPGQGGFGLIVVSQLCTRWGTDRTDHHKTVWADYRLGQGGAAPRPP